MTTARDGAGALALAESFWPDAALVDIGLPGIDGYELARRQRQTPQHRQMQLAAISGYGRPQDRDAARAAGFDAYLIEPAEIEEVQQLLANGHRKPAD